ncbi:hypothetical protein Pmar_PMAR006364 [Perkinsus marinus ATCC 50983]|uniref:Uncharacterized protein n=1 Tax=Perkinsus marinus (strain ATCC 50983 / TXsc) TaxID=423536 RepID=C5K9H2_PERM5|nr:hypothetical protein Pmar_PMAR006364 [Perkinsus marinus ATCC 50983]EER18744.1 hypothetical protein Pmar_PMAR006364 [Perkinsus marinus ATCC 50983]|eukprot:XP_002786948.1 hypothetical protein Pmar_PMAR006364 [Perkinsus marinus ATCC 50983]
MTSKGSMSIPEAVAATVDSNHLEKLYCVCRLCFNRLPVKDRKSIGRAPTDLVCDRSKQYYQIDFKRELTNLTLPKVLCPTCTRRLADFASKKKDPAEWDEKTRHFVDALQRDHDSIKTRSTVLCSADNRCRICQIASSRSSTQAMRSKSTTPGPGRPIEQSPVKLICSKCGRDLFDHDDAHCQAVRKRHRSHAEAGERFAERVATRGHSDQFVKRNLRALFDDPASSSTQPSSPVSTGVSHGSNYYMALTPMPYERANRSSNGPVTTLSKEAVRDMLRVGHLGLGKTSALQLGRVLRNEGIQFPEGGLKKAMEEKWEVFGPMFTYEHLLLERERNSEACSTPFGLCTDVNLLLNTVTDGEAHHITRLKFQFDGGQQFLKLSVNIVSMEEGSSYVASPNSVMKNFLIGMGQASESSHNLKELFRYQSVRRLFDLAIPKQVACDLKVSAMMVGIQSN